MGKFPKTTTAKCWRCGKETEWRIDRAFVRYNGICDILVCVKCGEEVPAFAFDRYQEDGRVIIPV